MGIWGPLIGGAILIGIPVAIIVNVIRERLGIPETFVQRDSYGNRYENSWGDIIFPLALIIGAGLGVLVARLAGWWTPPT